MGDVINFPGNNEVGIIKALKYFKSTYFKVGLSSTQIKIALAKLEPILREFLVTQEFELNLNGNSFTKEQVALITDAHNETMQSALKYFSERIWLALCNIAGLIGREAQNA